MIFRLRFAWQAWRDRKRRCPKCGGWLYRYMTNLGRARYSCGKCPHTELRRR